MTPAILDFRSLLGAVEQAFPIDVVDVLAAELARTVQARHVSLLIANLSGNALVRLSHVENTGRVHDGRNERTEQVALADSVYEQVLFTQEPRMVDSDGWLTLVPITERGDAIGVLEISFAEEPGAEILDHLVAGGHALAYVLIASRRHTDLFEWAQRDVPFSVSAEIQRRLLPPAYTLEAGPLTLAGWLEPSHRAGGDTFDYSLDREHLYLSVTDAMGHSVESAMLATLAVGTMRNRRRGLASPAEQADAAGASLRVHARPDQFVTGWLMRIGLADGSAEVVNAGHPAPFLLRNGEVMTLDLKPQQPLGVTTTPYRTDHLTLLPGDRLLIVTDGYLERNAQRVKIEAMLAADTDRHPRQIVQELARNLRKVTDGNLQDDATALCLDWYGPRVPGLRPAAPAKPAPPDSHPRTPQRSKPRTGPAKTSA